MAAEHPPAFEPTSSIELTSVADSKIISVSLYSSRAEITRLYRFTVKTGQNQVNISGLPNVLEPQSLRVEGRGAATIHDVTVSTAKGEGGGVVGCQPCEDKRKEGRREVHWCCMTCMRWTTHSPRPTGERRCCLRDRGRRPRLHRFIGQQRREEQQARVRRPFFSAN
ncbi:hypothetical protein C8R45DRAFT_1036433 [Mycena sanguinolenta]|nr:hypothetical protein C8R45DRAFT_1036433 [Mycena sanguinolenta]